jgi:AcrR family transcriptional regulator
MPKPDFSPPENTGRKAAYVARNRLALLKSTQEILAIKGDAVTIEDIAEHAEVAVSTIYKHFKDKNTLIEATLIWGFSNWEEWAWEQMDEVSDPLEQLVKPMRLFVRAHQTHPEHAQSIANFFTIIQKVIPQIQDNLRVHIELLDKVKILDVKDSKTAARNIQAVMTFAVIDQVINPKATIADADKAVQSALSMLGISEAKAKALTHSKLALPATNK